MQYGLEPVLSIALQDDGLASVEIYVERNCSAACEIRSARGEADSAAQPWAAAADINRQMPRKSAVVLRLPEAFEERDDCMSTGI